MELHKRWEKYFELDLEHAVKDLNVCLNSFKQRENNFDEAVKFKNSYMRILHYLTQLQTYNDDVGDLFEMSQS